MRAGVSFVVPVRNGERWLDPCLTAILAQRPSDGRPFEVITVEDGSTDASPEILERFASNHGVKVLTGRGSGAAAALNTGVAASSHPIICQVDQDVVLDEGWMQQVVGALESDPGVAAAQAEYRAAPDASIWARVTDLDLRLRWWQLHRGETTPAQVDHVCTGNTAYRRSALDAVGGFDETLGYGYDNDLSYRLGAAGYRLVLCGGARAVHHWRQSAGGYLRQQYGQGYGRLDVVARHPRRASGDAVSSLGMVLHAPLTLAAVILLISAGVIEWFDGPGKMAALSATVLVLLLVAERFVAGTRAVRLFGNRDGLAFAPVHLLRNFAWAAAIVVWGARRLTRRAGRPGHSMGDLR